MGGIESSIVGLTIQGNRRAATAVRHFNKRPGHVVLTAGLGLWRNPHHWISAQTFRNLQSLALTAKDQTPIPRISAKSNASGMFQLCNIFA